MDHQARAEAAHQAVLNQFYVPEERLFREDVPAQREDRTFSFLWPYLSMLSAANAMCTAAGAGEGQLARLRGLLDGLEHYWGPPGYQSYVPAQGGGQRFYDDNAWAGLELLQAYAVLKDQRLLDRAQQVFDFVMTGWTDHLGGGLFWVEGDHVTGEIAAAYQAAGGPAGRLGFPVADANAAEPDALPSTGRQRFEYGWIYLRPDGRAEVISD